MLILGEGKLRLDLPRRVVKVVRIGPSRVRSPLLGHEIREKHPSSPYLKKNRGGGISARQANRRSIPYFHEITKNICGNYLFRRLSFCSSDAFLLQASLLIYICITLTSCIS